MAGVGVAPGIDAQVCGLDRLHLTLVEFGIKIFVIPAKAGEHFRVQIFRLFERFSSSKLPTSAVSKPEIRAFDAPLLGDPEQVELAVRHAEFDFWARKEPLDLVEQGYGWVQRLWSLYAV